MYQISGKTFDIKSSSGKRRKIDNNRRKKEGRSREVSTADEHPAESSLNTQSKNPLPGTVTGVVMSGVRHTVQ